MNAMTTTRRLLLLPALALALLGACGDDDGMGLPDAGPRLDGGPDGPVPFGIEVTVAPARSAYRIGQSVRLEVEVIDIDEEIIEAILGHAQYSGTPRTTAMAKHLFAVDELAGFIVACCKVRPNGIADLAPKSVKKKLKTDNFAAGCDRQDIADGMDDLGLEPTEHIQRCIDALRADGDRLGIAPDA